MMGYPLIIGDSYVVRIGDEWRGQYPVGVHQVILKDYKKFNDAPLGIECYATNGLLFWPEWIIGREYSIQENE